MSALDPTGLVTDTTTEILTAIEGDELATIDPALDTSPEEPLGQINGIFASQIEDGLALLQAIYGALDPNNAEGQQLDTLCAGSGTKRKPVSSTIVIAQCNLDNGHLFASGARDADGNIIAPGDLQAQILGHPEYVFTGIGIVPAAIFAGLGLALSPIDTTSAGAPANYYVAFECLTTGPIACNAGTLTVISPSFAGFNSVTNPEDAYVLGAEVESDAALRIRRLVELTPAGGGTVDSLRRSVETVGGVVSAQVLSNDDDVADGNGLPPHSFAAIVWDGATPAALDDSIAQAIWDAKPAGIKSYDFASGVSGTAVDSAGDPHTIGFSRATQDVLYVALSAKIDSTKFPSDGDAQIAAAVVAFGNALTVGSEVDLFALAAPSLTIAGVRTVSTVKCDQTATPTNTSDITTAASHIPRFDSSRVTVTHV